MKKPASRRLEAKRLEDVMLEYKCPKCGKSMFIGWLGATSIGLVS